MSRRILIVIPARYDSSRLPGKPLLEIAGRPMIRHVIERALMVRSASRVLVATDDERVARAVAGSGAEAIMTSRHHPTGTDRLAEVARRVEAELIVNLQGDEPLIEPGAIDDALAPLLADPTLGMSTTSEPLDSAADLLDPHIVKVVTNRAGDALYFSRSPIPYPRAAADGAGSISAAFETEPELLAQYARHTGLYAYRRDFLLTFANLPPSRLERLESLEQLRALEYGHRIRVVRTLYRSFGVDTPDDLARIRRRLEGESGDTS
jgi:3-deoxy-manno-octulosonate cytidylyltransferase (CMP-KDO synthetase)